MLDTVRTLVVVGGGEMKGIYFLSLIVLCPLWLTASALADCSSPANAIVAENCLAGTAQGQWDVSGAGDATIQGFAHKYHE